MRPLILRLLCHEEGPVVLVHEVARVRERPVPVHVIDMQMRVEDYVDVGRRYTQPLERRDQHRLRLRYERPRRWAETRVDQHGRVIRAHEDALEGQPPLLIRVDVGKHFADARERPLAVDDHVDRHSGFRPAKPSSAPCQ